MSDQNALAQRAPEFIRSKAISGRTARLLISSPDDPGQFTTDFGLGLTVSISEDGVSWAPMKAADPSTIFTRLPVRAPRDMASVPHPPYYPSYAGLSPEQKWAYLSWLKDVRQPIYIGYVFIYYYGLERHLLLGDYDSAFEEILELRRHHQHSSFQSYSRCALVCSSLQRKRPENLACLYSESNLTCLDNYDLLIAHQARMGLSVAGLLEVAHRIPAVNKRYIKATPEVFRLQLSSVLLETFQEETFPIYSFYRIEDLPRSPSIIYANISFSPEVRSAELPDFYCHPPFVDDVSAILGRAHERTKLHLAEERKAKRKKSS